jgi:zinc transport system ATP-binding protein
VHHDSFLLVSSCLLLSLENIDVVGGKGFLLKDISLTVEEGKLITLVGPNGAGKTTLLKVLLNLLSPTRGHVERRKTYGWVIFRKNLRPVLCYL